MATVLKIFSIAIKQLAKPVSKQLVEHAKLTAETQPDAWICKSMEGIGKLKHWVTLRVNARFAGLQGKIKFKELETAQAMKEGAEFAGEAFIFSVGAGFVVLFEVDKMRDKAIKDEKAAVKKKHHDTEIENRFLAIEQQLADLKQQNDTILHRLKHPPQKQLTDEQDHLQDNKTSFSHFTNFNWLSYFGL